MTLTNNDLVTLSDLHHYFSTVYVYLPLIQRNYKWPAVSPKDKPELHSAKQFVESLWNEFKEKNASESYYTIGMLTLYPENEEQKKDKLKPRVQLVDGQQRIITLKLLFKVLAPDINYFPICFERDERLSAEQSRQYYLEYLLDKPATPDFQNTDMVRFSENYNAIKSFLHKQPEFLSEKDAFLDYLIVQVKILFHCTNIKPFDEFLNINKNKTRFTISDHIKAQLMFEEDKSAREHILQLFASLSKQLFNDELFKGIGLGYISDGKGIRNSKLLYPDENRLKVLFMDRYKGNSRNGFQKDREVQHLEHYNNFLMQLAEDALSHQENQLNGYICFYYLNEKNIRYFKLLDSHQSPYFEEILMHQVDTMTNVKRQCFIESQLSGKVEFAELIKSIKNESSSLWIAMDDALWDHFKLDYKTYINKKYNEEVL